MKNIDNELKKLDTIMIKYISALKVLETQLEIINDDFKYIKKYNPIEHIKTRIKSVISYKKAGKRRTRQRPGIHPSHASAPP